ncbi:Zinc-binding protein A33 [Bagarius yarrelli]|uniref:Zinc-binding protein A33 n=1 Tax=Bagarius yarrelli TaxID=175774 RepID=A0A556V3R3_BAGYA|nr:Zinc-binding protein A33 [Bagarius yarrelli]
MRQTEGLNFGEDLTCSICWDLFRDPVMLGCMHHFCRSCITTTLLERYPGSGGLVVCLSVGRSSPKKNFQTNYLVSGLVEKVRANSSTRSARYLQKQLKEMLESQKSQKKELCELIQKDEKQMNTLKKLGDNLQKRVRRDFQHLHHFLQVEEAAMLQQMRLDEMELEHSLNRHLKALHTAVKELEQSMGALQIATSTGGNTTPVKMKDMSSDRIKGPDALLSSPLSRTCVQASIEEFRSKYTAPLQYTLWRKMFTSLKPGPLPLTFDKDTVHPSLQLSRDRTQVVEIEAMLPYKPNPKRFIQCVNVLGTQGFLTGKHYWEVGVGTKPKWDLGVALETVNRQTRVKLCPDNGYWTLRLRNNTEYSAGTQPWTPIRMTNQASSIGIFVDCEERVVSFYNADDMSLLYTFFNGPRGKAFPFFSTCLSEPGRKAQPISLLHFPAIAI